MSFKSEVDLLFNQLVSSILKGASYKIEIGLGSGPGAFSYLTSDIGHGYVDVNADYRS